MIPCESESPDAQRTLAVIELGRAWVKLCKKCGMSRSRVKQLAESMISLEEWEQK